MGYHTAIESNRWLTHAVVDRRGIGGGGVREASLRRSHTVQLCLSVILSLLSFPSSFPPSSAPFLHPSFLHTGSYCGTQGLCFADEGPPALESQNPKLEHQVSPSAILKVTKYMTMIARGQIWGCSCEGVIRGGFVAVVEGFYIIKGVFWGMAELWFWWLYYDYVRYRHQGNWKKGTQEILYHVSNFSVNVKSFQN